MSWRDSMNRLRALSDQACGNVYERCAIAAKLLHDPDFVGDQFHGDGDKALLTLQAHYFKDTALRLEELLALYNRYPDESEWRRQKYDLRRMLALLRSSRSRRATCERATMAMVRALRERVATLEAENRRLRAELHKLRKGAG